MSDDRQLFAALATTVKYRIASRVLYCMFSWTHNLWSNDIKVELWICVCVCVVSVNCSPFSPNLKRAILLTEHHTFLLK